MSLERIKEQIDEIAKTKNIKEDAILSAISAFLEKNYQFELSTEENAKLIKVLKAKILRTIYNKEAHKLLVNEKSNFNKIFGIDNIEKSFLEIAITEMESDGFISCRLYEWSLLEKGIYEAREMVMS